jgi:hypothetical protein
VSEESRPTALSELPLAAWVETLAGRAPVPAGGALALATLAGAAALASKMARLAQADGRPFRESAHFFLRAAEEDGESYAEALARRKDAADRCLDRGMEHLERAVSFVEEVGTTFGEMAAHLKADVAAAAGLGRASARVLLVNLAVNVSQWSREAGNAAEASARLEDLRERLERA